MLRAKVFTIILLAIAVNCASIHALPVTNCKSTITELENYMLIDIKSILPSESLFWANGVNVSKITNGREVLNKIERCASVSDSNDSYRRLQKTFDSMLFYLNQIAEMAWYEKIITPFIFREEVFINDYREIMDIITTLKSGETA